MTELAINELLFPTNVISAFMCKICSIQKRVLRDKFVKFLLAMFIYTKYISMKCIKIHELSILLINIITNL